MAQPPAYTRVKNFTGNPGNNTDHGAINSELDRVAASINATRANLSTLQADDGTLRPGVVTPDSISAALRADLIANASGGTAAADAASAAATANAAAAAAQVAAQAAIDAAAGLGVVDNIAYVTLTEAGTYAMADELTGVHHIGSGSGNAPNNVHNITQYIADMTTAKDAELLAIDHRFDWQERTDIGMTSPKSSDAPQWYRTDYGESPYEWCRHGLTWYVAMEAVGNMAVNTRVQIRNLRCMYLSNATGQWQEFDLKVAPVAEEWTYPFEPTYAGAGNARAELDANGGGISLKPVYPLLSHGYGDGHTINNPEDWRAVSVSMEFRLIKDDVNGIDDRANARYVVDCGLDYRPGYQWDTATQTNIFREWTSSFVVAAGNSKMLLATNDWRGSALIVPATRLGCTYAELTSNPPPFTINVTPGTTATTVILPPNPVEGQRAKFVSVAPINAVTITATAPDVGNFTFALAAEQEVEFRYRNANNTWYRIK